MLNFLRGSLGLGSAVFGFLLIFIQFADANEAPTSESASPAIAADTASNSFQQIDEYAQQSMQAQVTSVSQLSDVQPTDWAFQALQSLVERYGCIAGYPDATYRGNRALTKKAGGQVSRWAGEQNQATTCMWSQAPKFIYGQLGRICAETTCSEAQDVNIQAPAFKHGVRLTCSRAHLLTCFSLTRYEFAAGLNACLDRVNELIAAATANQVTREDLATLQRLQEEFSAELATLRGRVDALEAQTAELEANQFSTTTKLTGEAIFAVAGVFGDNRAVPSGRDADNAANLDDNVIFANRARLALNTSFFGEDLLRLRLHARNITPFGTNVTGTSMTRLGFDGDNGNNLEIDQAFYRFPLGERIVVQVDATNIELDGRGFPTYSPFESSARGAISRYGRFSPIYRHANGGAGVEIALNPQGAYSTESDLLQRVNVIVTELRRSGELKKAEGRRSNSEGDSTPPELEQPFRRFGGGLKPVAPSGHPEGSCYGAKDSPSAFCPLPSAFLVEQTLPSASASSLRVVYGRAASVAACMQKPDHGRSASLFHPA